MLMVDSWWKLLWDVVMYGVSLDCLMNVDRRRKWSIEGWFGCQYNDRCVQMYDGWYVNSVGMLIKMLRRGVRFGVGKEEEEDLEAERSNK